MLPNMPGVSRHTLPKESLVSSAEHKPTIGLCGVQANWHAGYWVPDMSIQCFTGWHRKLAIILGTPLMTLTWSAPPLPTSPLAPRLSLSTRITPSHQPILDLFPPFQ